MVRRAVILIGIMMGYLCGHGLGTHMYIGSQTFDVWQSYDPSFYNALLRDDSLGIMTRKFYYIGLTFPDFADTSTQKAIRSLLTHLHDNLPEDTTVTISHTIERNVLGVWIRIPVTVTARIRLLTNSPLRISNETYNEVQQLFYFNGDFPNNNPEKLKEMVEYTRSMSWSPVEKALIYGTYMHVIHDLYAHMVLQPALFGYPYVIESDSVIDRRLLYFPETYYELFTDTYIPDWDFIWDLYAGYSRYPQYPHSPHLNGFHKFFPYSFYTLEDRTSYPPVVQDWQYFDFSPVEKFVEAAQAVGYAGQGLTQERIEAFLHGWAILLYMTYGFSESDHRFGGPFSHLDWNVEDILQFEADPFLDQIDVDILDIQGNAGHLGDNIVQVVGDFLVWSGLVYSFIDPVSYLRDQLLKNAMLLLQRVVHLANGSTMWNREWKYFLEGVQGLDEAVGGAKGWDNDSIVTEDLKKLRRELGYWELYGQYPPPCKRIFYEGELERAIAFSDLYRRSLEDEDVYLDYEPWTLARKAGILGGLWSIDPDRNYYHQPGVFDLNFRLNNNYIYTQQNISIEGAPTYIDLSYDLVTFGRTKVAVFSVEDPDNPLVFNVLPGPDRCVGSLSFNAQEAVNQGVDTVFFEVQTKDSLTGQYTTMFSSDYRDPYFSHVEIYTNPYYEAFFVGGNPVRTEEQNPLADPAHYWPYVLILKDTLTELNAPSELMANTSYPWHSVVLRWRDNSAYEEGYIVERREEGGDWEQVAVLGENDTVCIDGGVRAFKDYWYRVWAYGSGVVSDTMDVWVGTYSEFEVGDSLVFNSAGSRKLAWDEGRLYMVFKRKIGGREQVVLAESDDMGRSWKTQVIDEGDEIRNPVVLAGAGGVVVLYVKVEEDATRRCKLKYWHEGEVHEIYRVEGDVNDIVELGDLSACMKGRTIHLYVEEDVDLKEKADTLINYSRGLYFRWVVGGVPADTVEVWREPIHCMYYGHRSSIVIFRRTPHIIGSDGPNRIYHYWGTDDGFACEDVIYTNELTGDLEPAVTVVGDTMMLLVYKDWRDIKMLVMKGSPYWEGPYNVGRGEHPYVVEGTPLVMWVRDGDVYVRKYLDGGQWTNEERLTYTPFNELWVQGLEVVEGWGVYPWKYMIVPLPSSCVIAFVTRDGNLFVKKVKLRPGWNGTVTGDKDGTQISSDGGIVREGVMIKSSIVKEEFRLVVDMEENRDIVVRVYNESGRVVAKKRDRCEGGKRKELTMGLRGLGTGVYFYEVDIGGKVYRGKFVKVE